MHYQVRNPYVLFPFDKISKDDNIIIYGAGEIGRQYIEQMKLINYANCLFMVDKNYKNIGSIGDVDVLDINQILNCKTYQKILIASVDYQDEIFEVLKNLPVPIEKIVKTVHTSYTVKNVSTNPIPDDTKMWDKYYEGAEKNANDQFDMFLKPILSKYADINYSNVLDFACGRGRIANIISSFSKKLSCCDINQEAIEFCIERFKNNNTDCEFEFINNAVVHDSLEKLDLKDETYTFIYSWDAMVHFTYKWIDFYLKEFYRIIRKNFYILLHHSNYGNIDTVKSEDWFNNPGGRTVITKEDVQFIAQNHNFEVIMQKEIDWGVSNLDCINLLRKG